MKITDKYVFFWKENLAQWNMTTMVDPLTGMSFNCCEQYMMYCKAMLFGDKDTAEKIMKAGHPKDQQDLGREVKGYKQDVWDANKYYIVFNGNWLKFTQNMELMAKLLSYKKQKFVEASPKDKIWGIGMDEFHPDIEDEEKWQGQNLLGQVLTEVRDRIVGQLSFQLSYYEVPVEQ